MSWPGAGNQKNELAFATQDVHSSKLAFRDEGRAE